jgi:hypothetical protein
VVVDGEENVDESFSFICQISNAISGRCPRSDVRGNHMGPGSFCFQRAFALVPGRESSGMGEGRGG